jgi:putative membrane protein
MIADALYAYLHFAAILALASALGAQALLLRASAGPQTLLALSRADMLYGISAGVVLATGLLRVYLGVKGVGFYAVNHVFWTKMVLFALIAALSILPTVRILRWRRALTNNAAFLPEAAELRSTRRLVFIELHLLALVPLAAVFMARGLGM